MLLVSIWNVQYDILPFDLLKGGAPRGTYPVSNSMKLLLLTLTMYSIAAIAKPLHARRNYARWCSDYAWFTLQDGICPRIFILANIPAQAQIIPKLEYYSSPERENSQDIIPQRRATNVFCKIEKWRQPAGTTAGKRPHFKPCEIHHVDVLAWLRRLRVAPSRTSPISTMHSRRHAFAQIAIHNHPTRRDFISARQAGTSSQRIYPAVAGPGMKPISSVGHG